MPLQRYRPEQIVTMLRQIEVGIANDNRLAGTLFLVQFGNARQPT